MTVILTLGLAVLLAFVKWQSYLKIGEDGPGTLGGQFGVYMLPMVNLPLEYVAMDLWQTYGVNIPAPPPPVHTALSSLDLKLSQEVVPYRNALLLHHPLGPPSNIATSVQNVT